MEDKVIYKETDSCVEIRLNRPHVLNALDLDSWYQLGAAFERAARGTLPVMLTGSGRAFCAGDDINEFKRAAQDADYSRLFFLDAFYRTIQAIMQFPLPIVAAVNGLAYGAGMEILLISDIVIAARSARFCLPEGRLGVFPAIFSVLGPSNFPRAVVSEMLYTMKVLDADAAAGIHLVNQVVPDTDLNDTVSNTVDMISSSPPASLKASKRFQSRTHNQAHLPLIYESLEKLAVEFSRDPTVARRVADFKS